MQAKTYRIRQPDYVEERETQYLLIWKEVPHWMVMDEEAYNLIKLCDGSRSNIEVVKQLYSTELQDMKFQEIKSFIFTIKKKGLLFLNELGEVPGIDHFGTQLLLEEVKNEGGKVISLKSYGSGLPADEFNNKPRLYKF